MKAEMNGREQQVQCNEADVEQVVAPGKQLIGLRRQVMSKNRTGAQKNQATDSDKNRPSMPLFTRVQRVREVGRGVAHRDSAIDRYLGERFFTPASFSRTSRPSSAS